MEILERDLVKDRVYGAILFDILRRKGIKANGRLLKIENTTEYWMLSQIRMLEKGRWMIVRSDTWVSKVGAYEFKLVR